MEAQGSGAHVRWLMLCTEAPMTLIFCTLLVVSRVLCLSKFGIAVVVVVVDCSLQCWVSLVC